MPYRLTPFVTNNYYHIFNRGVEKRDIFSADRDYKRFIHTIYYYQFSGPKPKFSTYTRFRDQSFNENEKIVDILCYCLMPNHFHLLIKQVKDNGVHEFISKLSNSYTKYYNVKHNNRVGPLFQGQFKAVQIDDDYQLLYISRYIHLNAFVSGLAKSKEPYIYSSYPSYFDLTKQDGISARDDILNLFSSQEDYLNFLSDYEGYALEIERIKHLLIDGEE